MSGEIQSISWQLDEDGGGEAKWFIDPSLPTYVRHGARKELE